MRRLPMRKIIDALRLRASGLTLREIGASLDVGHTTIRDHLKRCDLAGLSKRPISTAGLRTCDRRS